ncbi:MAG: DUF411 domain-containing protein [Zoogloeaceae bacterium]|jgi:hypothetical protein|nr:DUF411 domain-containing protein [Zoogloeaceae bacterium]
MKPAQRLVRIVSLLLALAAPGMALCAPLVKVWKDPNCGCCTGWIEHMKKAGFDVQVVNGGHAEAQKRLGVPEKLGSCHTAEVDGYAIEGHVPATDIERLLREHPKAVGLAAPGMPLGAPGMDDPAYGGKKTPYDVLLIDAQGGSTVFAHH